ncbi:MAG: hypothetical protein OXG72_01515 [Acidobacteria bacterium]|nr:hypothetical protein [Acidobacteriota bacterium]
MGGLHVLQLQLCERQQQERQLPSRERLAGPLREVEGRRAGGDDAQPVDVIGEQLQVQAYPAHVLRLVDDQRPATADEGAQSGQRLALEILPHLCKISQLSSLYL